MKTTKIYIIYFPLFLCTTHLTVVRCQDTQDVVEDGGEEKNQESNDKDDKEGEENQQLNKQKDSGEENNKDDNEREENEDLNEEEGAVEEDNPEMSQEEDGKEKNGTLEKVKKFIRETMETLFSLFCHEGKRNKHVLGSGGGPHNSSIVKDPCKEKPCGDKGNCTNLENEFLYACECQKGWIDDEQFQLPNCKKADESTCHDSLCEHGGKCRWNEPDNPNCECRYGFNGRWCEHGSDSKWIPSVSSFYDAGKFLLVLFIFGSTCVAGLFCLCITYVLCQQQNWYILEKFWRTKKRSNKVTRNHIQPKIPNSSSNEDKKKPLLRHKLSEKYGSKGTPISSADRERSTASTTKSKRHHSNRKRRDISEDEEKSVTKPKVAKELGSDGTPSSSNDRQEFTASPSKPKKTPFK